MGGKGEETLISYRANGAVQRVRVKRRGWTQARRAAFLTELADSCNVAMAARVAGMGHRTVYKMRDRDAGFRQAWREALKLGYERLEMALVHQALAGVNAIDIAGLVADRDEAAVVAGGAGDNADETDAKDEARASAMMARPVSSEAKRFALDMLKRAAKSLDGCASNGRRRATPEETDAALARQLDLLARKLAHEA